MTWTYEITLACGDYVTAEPLAAELYALGPGTEVQCAGCGWTRILTARRRNW